MRLRRDVVLVSSVLFTVAFVWATPTFLADARTWRMTMFPETDQLWGGNCVAPVGFASLAIILIGLIVAWTGYLKKVRWTWFVMFLIVWGWAFPVMILPILQHRKGISLAEWLQTAVRVPSPYRDLAMVVLMFSLMVIALLLPAKAFLWGQEPHNMIDESAPKGR